MKNIGTKIGITVCITLAAACCIAMVWLHETPEEMAQKLLDNRPPTIIKFPLNEIKEIKIDGIAIDLSDMKFDSNRIKIYDPNGIKIYELIGCFICPECGSMELLGKPHPVTLKREAGATAELMIDWFCNDCGYPVEIEE